jgi:PhnB protein
MAKKSVKKSAKRSVKKAAKKAKPARKSAKKSKPAKKAKKAAKKSNRKPAAKPAPAPVTSINPYLTFNGNCEDAFNFYKSVFGGDFAYKGRFNEMPPQEGKTMSESEGNKIMHVSLPISAETVLMGSDSSEEFGHATVMGNNFSISINAKSQDEADRLYNGLAQGGAAIMPMSKTFWGSYFGMLKDKYDIAWMVSFGQ